MKLNLSNPVRIFLSIITICLLGIYLLCDYNLRSVSKELMLNWARSEAAMIQEGNLLTSSSKSQRFLLASDYVQAIKLVKFDGERILDRLHFGRDFKVSNIPPMNEEIVVERVGFLHSRAFYKIPNNQNIFMIFDVESNFLNFAFFGVAAFVIFIIIAVFAVIRAVEKQEFDKREGLMKQALNDFLTRDTPSEIIEKSFPKIQTWWKDKKEQMAVAEEIALNNQRNIILGELASRLAHDILSPVRNIEILSKRATWPENSHKEMFVDSLERIKSIAGDIKDSSKDIQRPHFEVSKFNLEEVTNVVLKQKQLQCDGRIKIKFFNCLSGKSILFKANKIDFERSLTNIINNAVEASVDGSIIEVNLSDSPEYIKLDIVDFGKGIESSILPKIGTKSFSYAKENGTGIGIFYAKQFMESVGGSLKIKSVLQKGTTVSLNIPKSSIEQIHQILLDENQKILILEDEDLNQQVIRMKFKSDGVSESRYIIFSNPQELEDWLARNSDDFILYSDFYLKDKSGNELENGLQVIRRLKLENKSTIFTSAYEDEFVLDEAKRMGIVVLSKEEFYNSVILLSSIELNKIF